MCAYSLELTMDGGNEPAKAFRALKRFDSTAILGTTLQRFRDRAPLISIHLDRADRADILGRLIELLDELDRLGISYELSANNVPGSSPFWQPAVWDRAQVAAELEAARTVAAERRAAAKTVAGHVTPKPSPARQLLEQRWRDMDFSDLFVSEQNYITIWAMRANVVNGGFDAYFYNSSGDSAQQTLTALAAIGSTEVRAILSDAIELLIAAGGCPADRAARAAILGQIADDAFTELNERFYRSAEDVVGLAFRLVEQEYAANKLIREPFDA